MGVTGTAIQPATDADDTALSARKDRWMEGWLRKKQRNQRRKVIQANLVEQRLRRERERKKNKTTKQKIGIKEARNFNERNFIMNGNLAGINWAGKNYYYYYYY